MVLHSARRWCVSRLQKYISSCNDFHKYLDHVATLELVLQFGWSRVVMAGSRAFFFSPLSLNMNDCNICFEITSASARFDLPRLNIVCHYSLSFFFFFFFWLHKQPTNMCKLNILVHLMYKWLNVLWVTMSDFRDSFKILDSANIWRGLLEHNY